MPQTKTNLIVDPNSFVPTATMMLSIFPSQGEPNQDGSQIIISGYQIQGRPIRTDLGQWVIKPIEDSGVVSILECERFTALTSDDIKNLWPVFFTAIKKHIETKFPIDEYGSCGATLSVALQIGGTVYAAYVGDSELFVSTIERREGSAPIVKIQRLTQFLHHTADPQEQQRITATGGTIFWNRLSIPCKPWGLLALSRSIHNAPEPPDAKAILGLSSVPTQVTHRLEPRPHETCLIACSDGFVDYLGGEEACLAHLEKYFRELAQKTSSIGENTSTAVELFPPSNPRWEQSPRDDTTIMCVSTITPPQAKNNYTTLTIITDEYGGTNVVAQEITRVAPTIFAEIMLNQLQTNIKILRAEILGKIEPPELPPQSPTPNTDDEADTEPVTEDDDGDDADEQPGARPVSTFFVPQAPPANKRRHEVDERAKTVPLELDQDTKPTTTNKH